MPWLAEIAATVVSILITYISKHSDTLLDGLFSKLGAIISHRVGDTAAIIVDTEPYVNVEFDVGKDEVIKKVADEKGFVTFKQDLKKGDDIKIVAYGPDYCPDHAEIIIDNENVTYCVVLNLKKRKKSKKGA